MKRLAYTSLLPPFLEYGAASWDPFRKGQKNALDLAQKKAAKFANLTTIGTGKSWCSLER